MQFSEDVKGKALGVTTVRTLHDQVLVAARGNQGGIILDTALTFDDEADASAYAMHLLKDAKAATPGTA